MLDFGYPAIGIYYYIHGVYIHIEFYIRLFVQIQIDQIRNFDRNSDALRCITKDTKDTYRSICSMQHCSIYLYRSVCIYIYIIYIYFEGITSVGNKWKYMKTDGNIYEYNIVYKWKYRENFMLVVIPSIYLYQVSLQSFLVTLRSKRTSERTRL